MCKFAKKIRVALIQAKHIFSASADALAELSRATKHLADALENILELLRRNWWFILALSGSGVAYVFTRF